MENVAASTELDVSVYSVSSTNVLAASAYSTPRSVALHDDSILAQMLDDVQFWWAFIFSLSAAHHIPNVWLSPLTVVVSTLRNRIVHASRFSVFRHANSVNADTNCPAHGAGPPVSAFWSIREHSVQ